MSVRSTIWSWGPVHVFRVHIANPGVYIDVGRGSYNRAWRIWPPTFRRLY